MATIRKTLSEIKAKPFNFSEDQRRHVGSLTDEDIDRRADSDDKAHSDEELFRMTTARAVRRARERTGLSQTKFAERFHFSPGRLRDLEQGRTAPDSALQAYLKVIETEPELVAKIVNAA